MSTDVGVQVSSLAPHRRSKLHIACSDFLCLWQKSQSTLIPLLLLPIPDPLVLGSGFVFCGPRFATALSISRGIESTIRSAPLLLLSKSNPCYALGFDLAMRGFGRHILRSDDFSYRTIVTSRSFCRRSSQTRTHLCWAPGLFLLQSPLAATFSIYGYENPQAPEGVCGF